LPASLDEMSGLGFGEPIAVSAAHGEGMRELYEELKPHMESEEKYEEPSEDEEKFLNVAIVGRPNAGKSTLVNLLVGEERMLTGPEPGLTRDSIPIAWEYKGRPVRLVDTAGLRRKARITGHLEKISTHESLRAIRLAHVVILVIDATMPFDKQDLTIAHHVVEEGRALVVAANKWDMIGDKKEVLKTIHEKAEDSLAQVAGMPIVTLSALKGVGNEALMKAVLKIYDVWNMRVSTGKLNRWLEEMETEHPPPITSGRRIKLRYMTQIKSRPPTFSLWVNNVDLPESYKRFLTNGLRKIFGLQGVPIRWHMKKSENPFEDKKKTEYMNKKKKR
jgi:GTP-binding protein